ncbi:dynamin-like GTPase family protein [Pleurocapsa sp. PCC 7319]|uniref:dynamin-like GTPase family protein n=1 Tax=Pleurocapsa sp. PCC 7319 TaxID=118161 RepID=UPI00034A6306|nr:dynamin-like GTPase family protein [Pleurocapsa sp. PCC 7319]
MSFLPPQCSELSNNVNSILDLVSELNTNQQDIRVVEASLKKAIAPKFEIVFAGAFSAGKSMLINALLERELLYSAEGHATGTECYIEYADPAAERVVLTFLSESEIKQQIISLCQHLGLSTSDNVSESAVINSLTQTCAAIIEQEGGVSKSERAKKANALDLLLQGFAENRDRIDAKKNNTYSMEEFNFSNLSQAATYARRGSNSAVLTKVEYYCHHPLLEDGNVLVDMPGIDAPVKKDAELTYSKIEHPDTSAVICVLKPASAGEMTSEETELMEKMKSNMGIRDRVFYVFNRIDQTWYNGQLRQRLDNLIQTQFRGNKRVYKTSGLLGFYGSQIKSANSSERFGLNSLFAESVKGIGGEEETPQFVSEFNNYCANSGKLTRTNFRVSVNGYETPNENYTRILSEFGTPLIEQLIADSGIEEFRRAITRYLTEEKRPQLFANLAEDLKPVCTKLKQDYLKQLQELANQPHEIEAMKTQELTLLNQKLQIIGKEFSEHLENEVNSIVTNQNSEFESDFQKLKARMVSRLDELLQTFSVQDAYSLATLSHPRNATAPLIAVLVEALYYLANELEVILVAASETLVHNFCEHLGDRLKQQEYYRTLDRLLGEDTGIQSELKELETKLIHALVSEAKTECDRYVRESRRFYDEGTFSIYQFRQTLQQTSQGYDCASMVEAEPAIRQLLKLDFEPKVSTTIRQNFRQTINQTIKTHLLPMAERQAEKILQYYPQARAFLEQTLEQEAITKIALNQKLQLDLKQKIKQYNQSVNELNNCWRSLQLSEYQLPVINQQVSVINIDSNKIQLEQKDKDSSHYLNDIRQIKVDNTNPN